MGTRYSLCGVYVLCAAGLLFLLQHHGLWTSSRQIPVATLYREQLDKWLDLNPDDEPWSNIEPSARLVYHSCYGTWQCARLKVPLDWNSTSPDQKNFALAILRIPAKVHITDPRYGGAVIINPGGPGSSGVNKALVAGRRMQDTIDASSAPGVSDTGKYFDIIGFDPRGINHTAPRLECFPSSALRLAWQLQSEADGILGSSPNSLDMKWARYQARSQACIRRVSEQGNQSIAYYMSTSSVVRDVVEIAEQHGRWRETEAETWLKQNPGTPSARMIPHASNDIEEAVLNRTRWRHNAEKVQYWGISYGTAIGASLAANFPDRIERIVLDSVTLPEAVDNGSWFSDLQDTDKILAAFCVLCHASGPDNCAFYRKSAFEIMEAFENAHEKLLHDPIAASATDSRGPDIITYSDLKRLVQRAVYNPTDDFPRVARFLQAISEGNGSLFADWKADQKGLTFAGVNAFTVSDSCREQGPFSPACQNVGEWQEETQAVIWCGDGTSMDGVDKVAFKEYWMQLRNQSILLGDSWAELRLMCIDWGLKTKFKFKSPFSAKTSHPLLLVNNRVDPVTPLRNAFTVSSNYPGSAVLIQNTIGHGSLSAPAVCTENVIKAYFQNGTLPESGQVCEVDRLPFNVDKYQVNWSEIIARITE